jgi:hypothetical protein
MIHDIANLTPAQGVAQQLREARWLTTFWK